jgi:hypothetical protein
MKRVKVHFHTRFETIAAKRCWIFIPETFRYISDLQHELCMRFLDQQQQTAELYLTLEQYHLLPNEVQQPIIEYSLSCVRRVSISYKQVM